MLLSEVQSFGQALNKVDCAHAQKRLNFDAKGTDNELPNIVNNILEPKHMRRMDSTEKRKRRYDDESDRVTEEDYLEDSDPCKSICSGEERWPSRLCVSEDDIFLRMLFNVSLRPKNEEAGFYFDLLTEFQTPNLAPSSNYVRTSRC